MGAHSTVAFSMMIKDRARIVNRTAIFAIVFVLFSSQMVWAKMYPTMIGLTRKTTTALSEKPAKLPRAGVNTSVSGNMMRTTIMVSDATAVMTSPNFRVITSLQWEYVYVFCSAFMTYAADLTAVAGWGFDKKGEHSRLRLNHGENVS